MSIKHDNKCLSGNLTGALSWSTEKLQTSHVSGSFSFVAKIFLMADRYSTSLWEAGHTLWNTTRGNQISCRILTIKCATFFSKCMMQMQIYLVCLVNNDSIIRECFHKVEIFDCGWGREEFSQVGTLTQWEKKIGWHDGESWNVTEWTYSPSPIGQLCPRSSGRPRVLSPPSQNV